MPHHAVSHYAARNAVNRSVSMTSTSSRPTCQTLTQRHPAHLTSAARLIQGLREAVETVHQDPYQVVIFVPSQCFLRFCAIAANTDGDRPAISNAASTYATAPIPRGSYAMTLFPKLGASEILTVLGMVVSRTMFG